MISLPDLDRVLLEALPELAADRATFIERAESPQSFFSYSFIPTLQAALDRNLPEFCDRGFALIEKLLVEGDPEVRELLREEFFEYGPVCERWMKRALPFMQAQTRLLAKEHVSGSTS